MKKVLSIITVIFISCSSDPEVSDCDFVLRCSEPIEISGIITDSFCEGMMLGDGTTLTRSMMDKYHATYVTVYTRGGLDVDPYECVCCSTD